MPDVETLHDWLRASHIYFGIAGLIAFWIPVLARKGSPLHVWGGYAFAACCTVVVGSALIACGWAITSPDTFAPGIVGAPDYQATRGFIRFFFSILGWLALAVGVSLDLGLAIVRHRKQIGRLKRLRHRVGAMMLAMASVALLAYGLGGIMADALRSEFRPGWLLALGLGTFGLTDLRRTWNFLTDPQREPMGWWYWHMECMLGCGVGFYTAFAVLGFGRLLRLSLDTPWMMVPWIAVPTLGTWATHRWIKVHRVRFTRHALTRES
jgi:hypothetical protein